VEARLDKLAVIGRMTLGIRTVGVTCKRDAFSANFVASMLLAFVSLRRGAARQVKR
jgi:hypothetical protein